MNKWKGLFKKEWSISKWGIITLVSLNIFVVLLGPTIISQVFGIPQDFFTNTLVLVGAWLIVNILVGVGVLLTSLGHEMKQPDIWLHSPISMLQLVGAKALFATTVTAFLLVLGGCLLGISFLLSGEIGTISVFDGILSLLSVLIALFLHSIFVMAIGFFGWSVYQVIYSRIGRFSRFVTSILFILGIATGLYLSEKLEIGRAVSGFFHMVKTVGPVKFTDATFYNEHDSYLFTGIVPEGVVFSIGSLFLYGGLTIILFVAGSILFEKKVRY